MLRIVFVGLVALAACSPSPQTGDESQSAPVTIAQPIGPPGFALGTPLNALGRSGLEVSTACFQPHETEPNYYSANIGDQGMTRRPLSELVANPSGYYIGSLAGDPLLFDASCSVAVSSSGERRTLTPLDAAALSPQEPIT